MHISKLYNFTCFIYISCMHPEDSLINFVFWEVLDHMVQEAPSCAMSLNMLASGDTWLFVVKPAQLLSEIKHGLYFASLPLNHDGLPWD